MNNRKLKALYSNQNRKNFNLIIDKEQYHITMQFWALVILTNKQLRIFGEG